MTCIQLYYILVLELSSESDVNNNYVDKFFGDFLMKLIHFGPDNGMYSDHTQYNDIMISPTNNYDCCINTSK